jgi:predicted nucleic acid-binding protein
VIGERLFVDTAYVQALFSRGDQYHARALAFAPRLRNATEVWLTEAILVEVGNALSSYNRPAAVAFIEQVCRTANVKVVTVDSALLHRALTFYRNRADKTSGLTDCISFVVMAEQHLTDAVTADQHFRQAGFRALLLDA